MDNNQPKPSVHEKRQSRLGLSRLAWLPIPVFLVAMAALWVADLRVAWPLPFLYWLVHYGSVALGVTFIVIPAAHSFLANGQPSVLMLGCGVLMMDIGVTAMPSAFARSSDAAFAIYNTSALLGALCHFAGVTITARRKIRLRRFAMWVMAAYAGGTAAMGLVIWGAFAGWMPVFFVDGQGGTVLRSLVMSMAVAFFLLTAILLWQTNHRAPSPFLYWYALGLVLLAAGLAGSMAIAVKDSPLQWVARVTQVCGTVYMCVAAMSAARGGSAKGIPLAAVEEAWREDVFLASLRQHTPRWWVLRYGLAVAVAAAGLGLRQAATAWVGPGLPPYITLYPVVMTVALLGGFGPGLVATVLGALLTAYWVLPPAGFAVEAPMDRLGLVIFSGMGLFMSVVAEFYRRHRHKAAAYDREAALRESQGRLAAFAAATFEGIVESEAGRIVDCNEQFDQMLGYTLAELRGMEIASLVAPEDRDRVVANIRQGGELVIEHAALRKDGTRIVVEAHGQPVSPGSDRRLTAVRDITERKRAEAALRESRERLDLALASSGMATFDWDIVRNKRTWSQGVHSLLGTNPETFTGTAEEFFQAIHSEDRSTVQAALARAVETTGVYETEYRAVWPDGSVHHIATRGKVHRDNAGRAVLMAGVCWDVTERKLAQAALRESEVRYRTLFNTIDAGFCIIEMIFDAQGRPADYRFLEVNSAFEKQTGLHDAQGKRMRELAPAHEAHWFEIYGKIALTGEPLHFVNEARALNRWYDVYAYRVGAPESRQVAILFNDISAHKQAEAELRRRAEELRAANEELTRFNRVTVGRELRIIELKQQINDLCARLGQPPRYAPEPGEEAKLTP